MYRSVRSTGHCHWYFFLYDEPHRDKKEDRVLWDNQDGNKHTNDTPLERGEH